MKFIISILCVLGGAFSSAGYSAGFEGGNDFSRIQLEGWIHIDCPTDRASYHCREEFMEPGEAAYFTGDPGIDADQVDLMASHQDGSSVTKKDRKYLSSKNKTESAINLWIHTLFQDPLLEMGTNQVNYKMFNRGQLVSEGHFQATGVEGHTIHCRNAYFHSNDDQDCRNAWRKCRDYGWRKRYCNYDRSLKSSLFRFK